MELIKPEYFSKHSEKNITEITVKTLCTPTSAKNACKDL